MRTNTANPNRFWGKLSLACKARANVYDKFYLKILYAKDTLNEGWYTTKKELHKACRAFVDPKVVKYATDGW